MAVTAYAAKGDEERIRDAGAEGYVSKPISVLRFVEAVRALLDAAAARAAEDAQAEPRPGEGGDPGDVEGGGDEGEGSDALEPHLVILTKVRIHLLTAMREGEMDPGSGPG